MPGQDRTQARYVLAVRIRSEAEGIPSTSGWRSLPVDAHPTVLATLLRRQGRLLDRVGGTGLLLRIVEDGGMAEVSAILDHRGAMRDLDAPGRVPKPMDGDSALHWIDLAEAYAASLDPPLATEARLYDDGRKAIFRPMEALAEWASAVRKTAAGLNLGHHAVPAAIGACIVAFVVGAPILGNHIARSARENAPPRATTAYSSGSVADDLADGGTVRKLQGVAQAFGRKY